MLVVGLTGGIASGKSTVSKEISHHGIPIVDADVIAREVVEPGTTAHRKLTEAFLSEVPDLLDDTGRLNRPALGKAVFGKPEKLKVLNSIVHGAVKREIATQLFWTYISGASMVILDVPLLFEAGLHRICGTTISVSTDNTTQLKRLLDRNPELSEEDAKKRISSQLSMEVRNAKADRVIDNNGTVEELNQRIENTIREIRPNKIWTVLNWFPPFGLLVATTTITIRYFKDYCRGSNNTKEKSH